MLVIVSEISLCSNRFAAFMTCICRLPNVLYNRFMISFLVVVELLSLICFHHQLLSLQYVWFAQKAYVLYRLTLIIVLYPAIWTTSIIKPTGYPVYFKAHRWRYGSLATSCWDTRCLTLLISPWIFWFISVAVFADVRRTHKIHLFHYFWSVRVLSNLFSIGANCSSEG